MLFSIWIVLYMVNLVLICQAKVWDEVQALIDKSSLDDCAFLVGDRYHDSALFTYSKGKLTLDSQMDVWSASKWLTAATILKLVETGYMSLDDTPSRYLSWWTNDPNDQRAHITLEQLLSQTSGLENHTRLDAVTPDASDACCSDPSYTLDQCAKLVYQHNNPPLHQPGTSFAYGRNHWQIIGAMAVQATNRSSWNEVFQQATTSLNLTFGDSLNIWFPVENPSLGGGIHTSGNSYAKFLKAYYLNEFLSTSSTDIIEADHTLPGVVNQTYSPLQDWGYESHYGLGNWLECPHNSLKCVPNLMHSSLGAAGFYPFIDRGSDYYAILVVNGRARTSFELGVSMQPAITKAVFELRSQRTS